MAAVTLKNIRKSFGGQPILRDIDLSVTDGELVVVLGPSGCGKSTLLRIIAGLEPMSGGVLEIDGKEMNNVPPGKRGVAMVFQSYALYPHMTVYDNMAFALKQTGTSRETIKSRVEQTAKSLQIESLLDRKPAQLSGGQCQRVAIGRAMVRQPAVFLLDEPLSSLDAGLRAQMRLEIARLQKQLRCTMLYVTHDQAEAMTLADRMVILRNGEIEQAGTPLALYHQPRNRFVAGFLGTPPMNFIPVTVRNIKDEEVTVTLPGGRTLPVPVRPSPSLAIDDPLILGIRPENLKLHFVAVIDPNKPELATVNGTITVMEQLGAETLVWLSLEDGTLLTIRANNQTLMQPGDVLRIQIPRRHSHLFTADEAGLALARVRLPLPFGQSAIP